MARYLSKAKFAYSCRSPNSCGRGNDCLGISTRTFGLSAFCVASAAGQMDAREVSIVSIATNGGRCNLEREPGCLAEDG